MDKVAGCVDLLSIWTAGHIGLLDVLVPCLGIQDLDI